MWAPGGVLLQDWGPQGFVAAYNLHLTMFFVNDHSALPPAYPVATPEERRHSYPLALGKPARLTPSVLSQQLQRKVLQLTVDTTGRPRRWLNLNVEERDSVFEEKNLRGLPEGPFRGVP